ERAAVGRVRFARDVSPVGQPVELAGQRAGPGGRGGGQRAHGAPCAVGEDGQHIDVGRRQIQVGQRGGEGVQGGVGGPVQGEDHAARVLDIYHDIGLYDIAIDSEAALPEDPAAVGGRPWRVSIGREVVRN